MIYVKRLKSLLLLNGTDELIYKLMILLSLLGSSGCALVHYETLGGLSGKLLVEWVDADLFIFTPDKDRPLTFCR
jgi:hypothetical protein